ncbi:MAG: hypothetical protein EOM54_01000 [Clostridia bacterium]|nr:hypothetical protein [Clostridia bacterium]NCC68270.1 hypothetical protein [Clostridia bacterium]
MNEDILEGLRSFDRVWSRVAGEPGAPTQVGQADEAALREFIADESRDAAFYSALARRAGWASRMLRRMAAEESSHKRDLQLEYFLLTGDSHAVPPSCPVVGPVLDSMRLAYANELKGAESYLSAAEATKSERLGELYRLHASDEINHAEVLRSMISRAIG